jgi:hypothetical protein
VIEQADTSAEQGRHPVDVERESYFSARTRS